VARRGQIIRGSGRNEASGSEYRHDLSSHAHRRARFEMAPLSAVRPYVNHQTGRVQLVAPTPWGITVEGRPYMNIDGSRTGEEARLRRSGRWLYLTATLDV
jgi:hypothetical protein